MARHFNAIVAVCCLKLINASNDYIGLLPTVQGNFSYLDVMSKFGSEHYTIKAKQCDDFRIYYLYPPSRCNSSYCFEGKPYFKPNNSVVKPTLGYRRSNAIGGFTEPYIEYQCQFDTHPTEMFTYKVSWIVNGQTVFTKSSDAENVIENTALREGMISNNLMINVDIECGVQVSFGDGFGTVSKSPTFFAGIQVSQTSLYLDRNIKTIDFFEFHLTVPFGCFNEARECNLNFEMYVPTYKISNDMCDGHIDAQQCRIDIPSTGWNKPEKISIKWVDSEHYELGNKVFTLQLKGTESWDHRLWSHYTLPEVKVVIDDTSTDTTYRGKTCYCRNDPHCKTFNGQTFEHEQDSPGTFLMYEHSDYNGKIRVELQTVKCNNQHATCNCGLAVRSGRDMFVIERCPHATMKRFWYTHCDDGTLQVIKQGDNNYKIKFPSGTYVMVNLMNIYGLKLMNVNVYPSATDEGKTNGLCGNLSGSKTDDTASYNSFHAYRVSEEKSLFSISEKNILDGLENEEKEYCTCPSTKASEGNINCSKRFKVKPICDLSPEKSKNVKCKFIQPPLRRRRSVVRTESTHIRFERDASTDLANVNRDEAMTHCRKIMESSVAYNACAEIQSTDPDDTLRLCVEDIMITGTLDWAATTLETYKHTCLTELYKNTTLSESPDNSTQSIADQIQAILCPGVPTCSNQGNCTKGACICYVGFGSSDCSVDLSQPPELIGFRGEGICDVSTSSCDVADIIADEVINSDTLTCKFEHFTTTSNNIIFITGHEYTVLAEHETLSEMSCTIPETPTGLSDIFTHGFKLTVSYDGINYGDAIEYQKYDGTCIIADIVGDDVNVTLKDNFCIINGKCVQEGVLSNGGQCYKCDPSSSITDWTPITGPAECGPTISAEPGNSNTLFMIIGVVISVIFLAALLVTIILIKLKTKKPVGILPPGHDYHKEKPDIETTDTSGHPMEFSACNAYDANFPFNNIDNKIEMSFLNRRPTFHGFSARETN